MTPTIKLLQEKIVRSGENYAYDCVRIYKFDVYDSAPYPNTFYLKQVLEYNSYGKLIIAGDLTVVLPKKKTVTYYE